MKPKLDPTLENIFPDSVEDTLRSWTRDPTQAVVAGDVLEVVTALVKLLSQKQNRGWDWDWSDDY